MNISIPTGGENSPKKELPTGKTQSTIREPTQIEERAYLDHLNKEIKETTALNPVDYLP